MTEAILLYGDSYRNPTILWRTGFLAPDPVVYFEHAGKGTLLVNSMELERARKEARVDARSYDDFDFSRRYREVGREQAYAEMITALLSEHGVQRVEVPFEFPVGLARALDGRDVEVVAERPVFEAERRHKSAEEQAAIERAQQGAQSAMTRARELLRTAEVRDGMLYQQSEPLTSAILISAIEVELLNLGLAADGTIAAGGAEAADPHVSDSGHLAAAEAVIIDIFPQDKKSRYFGDMTRTFVVGEPGAEWLKMYDTVKAAHGAALAEVRAGANGRDVHLAVCRTLYDAGYGTAVEGFKRDGVPTMIHGTGHGVGLEVHEAPRVSDVNEELVEGDVITIEPGLYSAEHGGVRLEDTVAVTRDGYRNLTNYPMDWQP